MKNINYSKAFIIFFKKGLSSFLFSLAIAFSLIAYTWGLSPFEFGSIQLFLMGLGSIGIGYTIEYVGAKLKELEAIIEEREPETP